MKLKIEHFRMPEKFDNYFEKDGSQLFVANKVKKSAVLAYILKRNISEKSFGKVKVSSSKYLLKELIEDKLISGSVPLGEVKLTELGKKHLHEYLAQLIEIKLVKQNAHNKEDRKVLIEDKFEVEKGFKSDFLKIYNLVDNQIQISDIHYNYNFEIFYKNIKIEIEVLRTFSSYYYDIVIKNKNTERELKKISYSKDLFYLTPETIIRPKELNLLRNSVEKFCTR